MPKKSGLWDDSMYYREFTDDYDPYCLRGIGHDELLQGDGWSDPNGRDMYSDFDYDYGCEDDDLDELLEELFAEIDTDKCRCDVDKIFDAAEDLARWFRDAPKLFPRNHAQVEGFALPGRKTYGSWSRWVDYSRSQPKDFGNVGCISLTGCSKPGHSCRVLMTDDHDVIIDGQREVCMTEEQDMRCLDDELALVDLDANEPDTEVLLMMEIAEELRYDERNHGLLHKEDLNAEILKVDLDDLYTLAF
jgi:hypothetical protein